LENALDNNFLTNFPGLTVDTLRRHVPTSIPMDTGHMDQIRQNVHSTKPPRPQPEPETDPTSRPITVKTHQCFTAIYEPHGQIYSDQTGCFIVPSSSGNNYIMVSYDYDGNSIFAQPFKNRTAWCILRAYKTLHEHLTQAGLKPRLQRLDNKCSQILKQFMHEQEVDFQLVPPGMHRRNAAKHGILTFQNHLSLDFTASTRIFHCICGISFSPKPKSRSIYFVHLTSIPTSLHTPNSTAHSTSIKRR
jgi:hypothetical protein